MTTLLAGIARSQWRVGVTFDSAFAGMADAAIFSIARADGVGTTVSVNLAFNTDTLSVDLALSEALDVAVLYVVTATGVSGSAKVSYLVPPPQPIGQVPEDDPEAEAFGVDLDWLAPSLDRSGDIPELRGRAALTNRLAAIAVTEPGELFHRPSAGGGLRSRVNGTDSPDDLGARVRSECLKDQAVKDARMSTVVTTAGETQITGQVTPVALNEPLPVKVAL